MVLQYIKKYSNIQRNSSDVQNMSVGSECCHFMPLKEKDLIVTIQNLQSDFLTSVDINTDIEK